MTKQITLKDGTELRSVQSAYGNPIEFFDDWGALWAYRDAEGLRCVVAANSWHDALEAAYDTLPTIAESEVPEAYGFETLAELHEADSPELLEGYQYQSNATGTGIVSVSLNGETLEPLTTDLLCRLGWTLEIGAY